MAEWAIQTLCIKPSNPIWEREGRGVNLVYGVNFLMIIPSLVEGETLVTNREVCYALMRPCFPPRPEGFIVPRYAVNFLMIKPSLAAGERLETSREVCYALMRPCFAVPGGGMRRPTVGVSFLMIKPSLPSFIWKLDYTEKAIQTLMIKPSVRPATPTYEWKGKVGYYHG